MVRRDQDQCEIAEFSNGDDWPRPVMTQLSSEALSKDFLLIGRNAWLSQQFSLKSTIKILVFQKNVLRAILFLNSIPKSQSRRPIAI